MTRVTTCTYTGAPAHARRLGPRSLELRTPRTFTAALTAQARPKPPILPKGPIQTASCSTTSAKRPPAHRWGAPVKPWPTGLLPAPCTPRLRASAICLLPHISPSILCTPLLCTPQQLNPTPEHVAVCALCPAAQCHGEHEPAPRRDPGPGRPDQAGAKPAPRRRRRHDP